MALDEGLSGPFDENPLFEALSSAAFASASLERASRTLARGGKSFASSIKSGAVASLSAAVEGANGSWVSRKDGAASVSSRLSNLDASVSAKTDSASTPTLVPARLEALEALRALVVLPLVFPLLRSRAPVSLPKTALLFGPAGRRREACLLSTDGRVSSSVLSAARFLLAFQAVARSAFAKP